MAAGKFIETVKLWQEEWFYMADVPLGNREGVPAFSAVPLERLHSWMAKNLTWGNEEELEALQDRVNFFIGEGVTLVDVAHVMLHRRVQPLQALGFSVVEIFSWAARPRSSEASIGGRTSAGCKPSSSRPRAKPFQTEGTTSATAQCAGLPRLVLCFSESTSTSSTSAK